MYVLSKNIENIKNFLMNILNFHNLRKICILHGRVFVMCLKWLQEDLNINNLNKLRHQKTKAQISCAVTAQLISALVFTVDIVQILFFLNLKSQGSSLLLWPYSPICIRPVWKPHCWFSHKVVYIITFLRLCSPYPCNVLFSEPSNNIFPSV